MQTTKSLVQRLEDGIALVHKAHPQLPVAVVRVVRFTDLLSRLMFARLDDFFAPHGLTDTSWLFLTSVYTAPGGVRSPSEVGRVLAQSKPHMTRLADELVAKGLIRRARSEQDRRRVVLAVTPKGRHLVERLLPEVWAQHERIARSLSRADLAQLSALLAKWLGDLDGREPQSAGASGARNAAGRTHQRTTTQRKRYR
jgi:MarR family transcriptional repressor of emrRAB